MGVGGVGMDFFENNVRDLWSVLVDVGCLMDDFKIFKWIFMFVYEDL